MKHVVHGLHRCANEKYNIKTVTLNPINRHILRCVETADCPAPDGDFPSVSALSTGDVSELIVLNSVHDRIIQLQKHLVQ